MRLRKIIENELKKEGTNQTILANRIGVSQATIYKILNTDTEHKKRTLSLIADYFHIPVSSLLDDDPFTDTLPSSPNTFNYNILLKTLLGIESRLAKLETECVHFRQHEKEFNEWKLLWQARQRKKAV